MSENMMTCSDCDELFLDHFEGTLDGDARVRFDDHVSSCARCQGLIRDVNAIREEAAALPELVPSRDLWSGIEARIQPEVVSIADRPARSLSRRWLAAAAAALVVATSGVTYLATSRSIAARTGAAPSATLPPQVAVAQTEAPAAETPAAPSSTSAEAPEVSVSKSVKSAREPERALPSRRASSGTSLASSAPAPLTASDLAFAGEISQLQSVLIQRRAQLDPETIKVVEDNLKLIDAAAKRARAALAKDPASAFLTRQLDNALQKKVELLRTVALLPAST